MKYLLDAKQSKLVDYYSIEKAGIPSVVLMERAALSVTELIMADYNKQEILCICGSGNNGADGLAVARQLLEKDVKVSVYLVAGNEKEGTKEYELQKNIAKKNGINFIQKYETGKYGIIVDAIFGIGLSRDITGKYADLINEMNSDSAQIIAIDVPSGINATDGSIMGCAVKADKTVTFGFEKLGLAFYPGAAYAGKISVENIGFAKNVENTIDNKVFYYDLTDLKMIPDRRRDGNKGTYGKILIAAGSKNMGGAALFSGMAAYRCGCGLVKLLTHELNRDAVLKYIPESLMTLYNEQNFENEDYIEKIIRKDCLWADCVVLGPGISTEYCAEKIVQNVLDDLKIPVIIDADALNIIAENNMTGYAKNKKCIITPHIGEMARLTKKSISEIKKQPIETAKQYALQEGVVCVLKDARTIVTDGKKVYLNVSGCDAMATGGSGDVLTGVIAGMIAAGLPEFEAAALGCFIHGKAGEYAGTELGNRAVTARNIADYVGKVLK